MDISSIESELAASTTDIESLRKELEELTNRFKEKEAAYQKLQAELEQKKNRVNDYQMQLKNITMREQSSDDSSNSLHGSVLFIGSYKNSPIAWRVVDEIDNRILLISEEIIECRWFDRKSNKYQNSEIRSWLNNDFLKQVFLAGEAAYIVPVQYTECTNDKIFLLSKEEIIKYFPTD